MSPDTRLSYASLRHQAPGTAYSNSDMTDPGRVRV
jgi:hypothetical protein